MKLSSPGCGRGAGSSISGARRNAAGSTASSASTAAQQTAIAVTSPTTPRKKRGMLDRRPPGALAVYSAGSRPEIDQTAATAAARSPCLPGLRRSPSQAGDLGSMRRTGWPGIADSAVTGHRRQATSIAVQIVVVSVRPASQGLRHRTGRRGSGRGTGGPCRTMSWLVLAGSCSASFNAAAAAWPRPAKPARRLPQITAVNGRSPAALVTD